MSEPEPQVTAEWLEGRYFCYPIECAACEKELAGAEENGTLGRGDALAIDADGGALCPDHTDEIHFVAAGTYAYGGGTPCETNRSFQPEDVVAVRPTDDADQLATDGGRDMTEWECGNCGDSFETPGEPELPCLQCGADDWREADEQ